MENKLPLVSIVFTSYNHKEYLVTALESLINQTYSNIEIIIIDDCSTDGSQEVLSRYNSFKNVNIKLQSKNSGSYVKASNLGASYANGDYILFAQCDDFADERQIEILVNAIISNPNVGVVFSKSNLVNESGIKTAEDLFFRETKFKKHIKNNSLIKGVEMRSFLSFSCVIPNLSAALINHDLFKEIGSFSEEFLVVADWELWLNLSEKCDFLYVNKALNNFRQHSTTIRSTIKLETQVLEIYSLFYSHIAKYKLSSEEAFHFKSGAGSIWASYFLSNKVVWVRSFLSIHKSLRNLDKKHLYFLFVGIANKLLKTIPF